MKIFLLNIVSNKSDYNYYDLEKANKTIKAFISREEAEKYKKYCQELINRIEIAANKKSKAYSNYSKQHPRPIYPREPINFNILWYAYQNTKYKDDPLYVKVREYEPLYLTYKEQDKQWITEINSAQKEAYQKELNPSSQDLELIQLLDIDENDTVPDIELVIQEIELE